MTVIQEAFALIIIKISKEIRMTYEVFSLNMNSDKSINNDIDHVSQNKRCIKEKNKSRLK